MENKPMLRFLEKIGFEIDKRREDESTRCTLGSGRADMFGRSKSNVAAEAMVEYF